ncbi:MAG: NAD(P)/FAD-dependent oxidoreductase [Myxococcaceae bacterium]
MNRPTLAEQAAALAPSGEPLSLSSMDALRTHFRRRVLAANPEGKVSAVLQQELSTFEKTWAGQMTPEVASRFQSLVAEVGGQLEGRVAVPEFRGTLWTVTAPDPLRGFRSTEALPDSVDVAIIGAGMAGGAQAHALAAAARAGLRVAVFERGGVASATSSENGGNTETTPEGWLPDPNGTSLQGPYKGYAHVRYLALRARFPDAPEITLRAQAYRTTVRLMRAATRSGARRAQAIVGENIACHFSPLGSTRVSDHPQEDAALEKEARHFRRLGIPTEFVDEQTVRALHGLARARAGRRVLNDFTLHPRQYVQGLFLQSALPRGVRLYTETPVLQVISRPDYQTLVTSRGEVRAGVVVNALNAYSGALFPELAFIRPTRSHIAVWAHAPRALRGSISLQRGDMYWSQPEIGASGSTAPLLAGGGPDVPRDHADDRSIDVDTFEQIVSTVYAHLPALRGQPPILFWASAGMGFTADRLPVYGRMEAEDIAASRRDVFLLSACNGNNVHLEEAAANNAELILRNHPLPEFPTEDFALSRFAAWEREPDWPKRQKWWETDTARD